MKRSLLILITAMFTLVLYAQDQYATTNDGKKVLLKSNGTWEYVTNNTPPTNNLYSSGGKSTASNSSRTTSTTTARSGSSNTGRSTGRKYIRGPRGGCYYINRNGNKTYVNRSLCN